MRCAVLGSPIAHSLSPVLHRAAYRELGLDWSYEAVEVDETALPGFLATLDDTWRGLSLTMPLKRAVVPLLDDRTALVERSGVANTVVRRGGRLWGDNTDVPGFCAALRERGLAEPSTALVVGGGATAASVVIALADLGCREVTVAVRAPARARAVEAVAGPPVGGMPVRIVRLDDPETRRREPDLLVSTVPAAAQEEVSPGLPQAAALFDVIYDPWPTPLAARYSRIGLPVLGGLELLVHQAVGQVEEMTGRRPAPLAAMRAAGKQALAARRR